MKKAILRIGLCVTMFQMVQAQTQQEYMDLVKSAAKIEVKSFVYDGLQLSEAEMQTFDPIFEDYLKKSGQIAVRKWQNFAQYLQLGEQPSLERLNDLNTDVFRTDLARLKLNKRFYNKMKKAIGVQKTTLFFFLQRYVHNRVEGEKLNALAY
ncbi:MAG: hypothetical protein AB3N16_01405 [Flavobacteriaceae bacterium]